ncbi:MAG: translation elongation factor Ts [Clostridiaceae bacterium]|jgi:elongation factor Ts|nr:translation elongation factor Ts [Bacillota bacterium]NLN51221.1 translation elongation factor Ts [Clostridiaceae bacterium]
MAKITAAMVKELRELTGAGMMDCKNALAASDGDQQKAIAWLREKGMAGADKRSGKVAAEGVVDSYIHGDGRIGVLIEVNIETDFAAKNEEFRQMVKDIAMQVASMNPAYLSREDIPEDVLENEREIARNQALNEGKPEHIVDKIVEGRLEKFYENSCLLDQPFIKDEDKTVNTLVKELIAKIGENIQVRRFTRYELGEGIEKVEEDFAEEVAKQMQQ